jgi:adhesin HecA-like repeat protein
MISGGRFTLRSAELANRASVIVVGKLGTATVTVSELQASFA